MKSTPNYQKCPKHAEKHCQLYCENCNIPVCSTCVSSGKHKGHDISDVLEKIRSKTHDLQNDLQELETRIYPRYQELTFDVENEKVKFKTNYWRLATTVDEQGEVLHREITAIVNQRKSDIAEMENKHLAALNKNTDEITNRIAELRQIIEDLRKMLNSNDVSLISTYNSKNSKFRNLDICVADTEAKAVVVVNQSGKLRFRSTGHPSNTEESFAPVGITTDNQSQILTSDPYNNRIHILDQDGQLLRYIHNCGLNTP
ncbi:FNIP repeat-containing protein cigB-like [Ostrea edulis]|uniref:FNIP repeat-containing protein cigB-like n=1 Tax=Ostrea edulis TaxID=37623 RepID=UPI0024AEA3AF|nr:FNIP repeat-containing protein cigB-like [Ostrea edulis]